MGVDLTFAAAVRKALIASDLELRPGTPFLLSISRQSKAESIGLIRALHAAGCALYATEGTAELVRSLDIPVVEVTKKLSEGHPNVVDVVRDGTVRAVINTIEGGRPSYIRDGFHIRRAAVDMRIPCFTSIDTARAAVEALIASLRNAGEQAYQVRPFPEYRDGTPA
jgi:carbamoyl-phosphate synthase large subunit